MNIEIAKTVGEVAQDLARQSLDGKIKFLGSIGAKEVISKLFPDANASLLSVSGYMYLAAVQAVTGDSVTCDAEGFIVRPYCKGA